MHLLIPQSIHSSTHPFICSPTYTYLPTFHSPTYPPNHSSFTCSFIHPLTHQPVYLPTHSSIHLLTHVTHSPVYSFTISPSTHPPNYPSSPCLPIYPLKHPCTYSSIYAFTDPIHLSVHPLTPKSLINLSIYPFIYWFTHPSDHLPTHLIIHPSTYLSSLISLVIFHVF